jgi:hypothetical protein
MTQEDKELILKDISGRLPHLPIVQISLFRNDGKRSDIELDPHVTENIWEIIDKYHELPYLRSMSSMTEEEVIEFNNIPSTKNYQIVNGDLPWDVANYNQIDWLNKKMFDYRGLIPKGLAIEVIKENNPYED